MAALSYPDDPHAPSHQYRFVVGEEHDGNTQSRIDPVL